MVKIAFGLFLRLLLVNFFIRCGQNHNSGTLSVQIREICLGTGK